MVVLCFNYAHRSAAIGLRAITQTHSRELSVCGVRDFCTTKERVEGLHERGYDLV